MAHNGLALSARSDAGATGAGGEVTTCTAAAGSVLVDNAGGPACVASAQSASSASLDTAEIDSDAPPYTDSARTEIPIASFRIILRPAIAPTPPPEFAIFPRRTRPSGPERHASP